MSMSRKRPAPDDRRILEGHLATMSASLNAVQDLLKQSEETAAAPPPPSAADADTSCDSLLAVRNRLRAFAQAREWDQFHTPRNICLALVGEVGELCECFQWKGDAGAALGLPNWEAKKRDALGEELADVLLYLVRLADKCDVDLAAVTAAKLAKNAQKYPADRVRGSSKKYNEYEAAPAPASAGARVVESE